MSDDKQDARYHHEDMSGEQCIYCGYELTQKDWQEEFCTECRMNQYEDKEE